MRHLASRITSISKLRRRVNDTEAQVRRSGRLSGSPNALVSVRRTRQTTLNIMGASESTSKSPKKKKEDETLIPKNATCVEDFGYYWTNGSCI
jgi:hypothetical protein